MSIILDGTNGIVTPDIDSGVSTLGPLTQALNLGSTGQVVFPATQNASSDANTLDDYEEGTWTPAIESATPGTGRVTSIRSADYTKIGRIVHLEFEVSLETLGTGGSGLALIIGLPFPTIDFGALNVSNQSRGSVPFRAFGGVANGVRIILRGMPLGTTNPPINRYLQNLNFASFINEDFNLQASITYFTND